MQSPLNSWCWDVSVTWTLWSIYLGWGNSGSFVSCGGPHESQFHHSTWRFSWLNLEKRSKFLTFYGLTDWPSCLKVMMDCHLFFAYLSCSCHNMDLVFYRGLSSVYHPCLVTTQLIGSSALRRKKWTFNKAHLLIEMHSRWLAHEKLKMPRMRKAFIKADGGYFEESQI
jgi:hypothetical protein